MSPRNAPGPPGQLQRRDTSHGLDGDGPNLSPMVKGIRVAPVPAWIFQPRLSLGNHEAGSGRPLAKKDIRRACTTNPTHTTAASTALAKHVCVDHRRFQALVAQQLLRRADV